MNDDRRIGGGGLRPPALLALGAKIDDRGASAVRLVRMFAKMSHVVTSF